MNLDARSLPENEIVETDVCIVGAGTAGITLAHEFIGAPFKVVMLESGGLEPDRESQALSWGENIGFPYFPLDVTRVRGFGGSGNSWDIAIEGDRLGVRLRPFDPIDFEERDWVTQSGWPFTKAHLDPYYERAQAFFEVLPPSFDPKDWVNGGPNTLLPLNSNKIQTILYKFGARDLLRDHYRERIEKAPNITTFLHATVQEVETDESGRLGTRLQVACLSGPRFSVSAKIIILALGGLEVPRLLLISRKYHPQGLGNQHDLVGRFFMEHLHFRSGYFIPADSSLMRTASLYNQIQLLDGVAVIAKLSLSEHVIRQKKLLNQNVQLLPTVLSTEKAYKAFYYPSFRPRGPRGAVRSLYHGIRRAASKVLPGEIPAYRIAHMTEQIPNPESRVILSDRRDAFGQPRIQLDWKFTSQDLDSAARTQEILAEEINKSGLGQMFVEWKGDVPPQGLEGGHHHMGTTRMHRDPKQGVVDENARIHGTENIYIAGPSVFPTGGYANPVLSAIALSIRLADHVKMVMES